MTRLPRINSGYSFNVEKTLALEILKPVNVCFISIVMYHIAVRFVVNKFVASTG
jgi:hypothetical protein